MLGRSGGELVYSDVLAGGVWACSPEGRVDELLAKRRGIGGIVPHAGGGWVISGRSVVHLAPDGSQRTLLADEDACGYNDLGTTAQGDLLAGVLRYRPLAGEPPTPGRLLRPAPAGAPQGLKDQGIRPDPSEDSPDRHELYRTDQRR